jgi:hypothetical protein
MKSIREKSTQWERPHCSTALHGKKGALPTSAHATHARTPCVLLVLVLVLVLLVLVVLVLRVRTLLFLVVRLKV